MGLANAPSLPALIPVPLGRGVRRSEPAGAERALLDLEAAILELGDTRIVVDGKTARSDVKTDRARRTISLDAITINYLRGHLAMLDGERTAFGAGYHDSGKLMCHLDGTPVHSGPGRDTPVLARCLGRGQGPCQDRLV